MSNEITIVCVYNNKVLSHYLFHSCEKLLANTFKIQYLFIDNSLNKYTSAAQAYNSVLDLVIHPIVIFTHQDIEILSDKFIIDAVSYLNNNPKSIIGVAGANEGVTYSNMRHGKYKISAGKFIAKELNVQTVDECFIITTRKNILTIKFDDVTCNGWHLYGVDLSLSATYQKIESVVLPSSDSVFHKSTGKIDINFYLTMRNIIKKHNKFKNISTTCFYNKWNIISDSFYSSLKILQLNLNSIFKK
jgi:hypothetical protein